MDHAKQQAARDALIAIRGMVDDALASSHVKRHIGTITRLDVAYDFRRLQHAAICHYLRCDASREVLEMIGAAVDTMLDQVNRDDPACQSALKLVEPYRHHLYSSVIVVALVAADKAATRREQEYWRNRNAMRIAPVYQER
ncbi:MAG: hypothetical protein JWM57_2895 [Phycisphaerales bacterium]|nr:hypothetical protein [Phycisphaerales bacterium]